MMYCVHNAGVVVVAVIELWSSAYDVQEHNNDER